ncbi:MAG TPA: type II toxin-antitoxin system HicB family antitoxin [Saprospiraceae bacterium]|nr:type II toxin-antitoxin system HicB family antitoxin [Saprospiraceae bacterium]
MSHSDHSEVRPVLFFISESDEGGYIAKSPEFGIFTQGETRDELTENIKEAIHCHFDEGHTPTAFTWQMIKGEVVT